MNAIPNEDREAYVYIRAQCYCLVDWIFAAHSFTVKGDLEPVEDPYMDVYINPFVNIWEALYYHAKLLQDYHPDIPGVEIRTQLVLCFQKDEGLLALLDEADCHDHLSWDLEEDYVISRNDKIDFDSVFPILSLFFFPLLIGSRLFAP